MKVKYSMKTVSLLYWADDGCENIYPQRNNNKTIAEPSVGFMGIIFVCVLFFER